MKSLTEIKKSVYGKAIEYLREHRAKDIDDAYDSFWEEEYPEDCLGGPALELSFINFEDWLLCDYKTPDGKFIIDSFSEKADSLGSEEISVVNAMKESFVSIYMVKTSEGLSAEDLLTGAVVADIEGLPTGALRDGDVFGARFLKVGGRHVMSGAVYPIGNAAKDLMLGDVRKQYERFKRNEEQEGSMEDFLRKHSYAVNIAWYSNLYKKGK